MSDKDKQSKYARKLAWRKSHLGVTPGGKVYALPTCPEVMALGTWRVAETLGVLGVDHTTRSREF